MGRRNSRNGGGEVGSGPRSHLRSVKNTMEEKAKQAGKGWWQLALKTISLIAFYYLTSIGLTFYQSWLLKKLNFPLTIVLFHFCIKLGLSWLSRVSYTIYTGLERVSLGWSQFLGRVGIVAVVASLDIALSQWSFEYIDVALYTITKSSSIIFILFFAILFGLERKHWSLIVIVSMIASGLFMFTYKSTDFSIIGFIMVLSASFVSGIRWTLSQSIMQRSSLGLSNPIDMIFHVQPIMMLAIIPFTCGIEGYAIFSKITSLEADSLPLVLECVGEVMAGGVLAFLMEAAEFLLVTHTSSLTLSIAGILKEIISLSIAVIYQSNNLSLVNLIGLVVCLSGISLHVARKAATVHKKSKQQGRYTSVRTGDISLPLLSGSESDSEEELYRTTTLSTQKKTGLEANLLTGNREWTSIRDKHVEYLNETKDAAASATPPHSGEINALEESEKLLNELDLLSSD